MFPKKKISNNTRRKMIEGYEKGANEDLEITKDFEAIEKELDEDSETKRRHLLGRPRPGSRKRARQNKTSPDNTKRRWPMNTAQ